MRHADVGSDHNLFIANTTLNLRKSKNGTSKSKRYDVTKLKNKAVREEFKISLRKLYSIFQDETDTTIDQLHKALNETATEILGYKRNTKNGVGKKLGKER